MQAARSSAVQPGWPRDQLPPPFISSKFDLRAPRPSYPRALEVKSEWVDERSSAQALASARRAPQTRNLPSRAP